jgi:hypothetical protein
MIAETGPKMLSNSLVCAAVRLHQSGLSLRLGDLGRVELTQCGKKRQFTTIAPMAARGVSRLGE